jgi:hypothetical protein
LSTAKSPKTPQEILKELKPCHWKYKPETGLGDKIHYGFIAQDLLEIGEEYAFVNQDEKYLRVNYQEFIGILVSVIKDQEERISKLENILKGQ